MIKLLSLHKALTMFSLTVAYFVTSTTMIHGHTWQGNQYTNIPKTYGRKHAQINIPPLFYTSLCTVPIAATDVRCVAFLQITFTSLKRTDMLTVVVTGNLSMPRYVAFTTPLLPRLS
jgi:hypothetical protein